MTTEVVTFLTLNNDILKHSKLTLNLEQKASVTPDLCFGADYITKTLTYQTEQILTTSCQATVLKVNNLSTHGVTFDSMFHNKPNKTL